MFTDFGNAKSIFEVLMDTPSTLKGSQGSNLKTSADSLQYIDTRMSQVTEFYFFQVISAASASH